MIYELCIGQHRKVLFLFKKHIDSHTSKLEKSDVNINVKESVKKYFETGYIN